MWGLHSRFVSDSRKSSSLVFYVIVTFSRSLETNKIIILDDFCLIQQCRAAPYVMSRHGCGCQGVNCCQEQKNESNRHLGHFRQKNSNISLVTNPSKNYKFIIFRFREEFNFDAKIVISTFLMKNKIDFFLPELK